MKGAIGRVVDANANRAREGLRVMEEVTRFFLNDQALCERIRRVRHETGRLSAVSPGGKGSTRWRDSESDVGRNNSLREGTGNEELPDLVAANARRVQEAMRVLEEFSRLGEREKALAWKELRFTTYTLEKDLLSRLGRKSPLRKRRRKVSPGCVYVILDRELVPGKNLMAVAKEALAGGAGMLQLRDKKSTTRKLLEEARCLRDLVREHPGTLFVVNDRPDVARAAGADGVHLGGDDLPVGDARALLGEKMLVGASTHSVGEARQAEEDGADYVAVGPVFRTRTKADAGKPVGTGLVKKIKEAVTLPLVAIGGIDEKRAPAVRRAGADAIAVAGAVLQSGDVRKAVERLRRAFSCPV